MLLYRSRGAAVVRYRVKGRVFYVNGRALGVDMTGLETTAALRLLRHHRRTIESVTAYRMELPSAVIQQMQQLAARRLWLILWNYPGPPERLAALAPLAPRLRGLLLKARGRPEDYLPHVARLTQLRWLGLRLGTLTPHALAQLHPLSRLRTLRVERSGIGDAGLELLGKLRSLRRLTELRLLTLSGTRITDAALVHLGTLRNLRHLSLNGLPLTDRGLWYLSTLKNLRKLLVYKTQVTESGALQLRQRSPRRAQDPACASLCLPVGVCH